MPEQNSNDVDLNVVGTGCGASCGLGCLQFALMMLLVVAMGGPVALKGGLPQIVGFLGGVVMHIAVGYIVAKAARDRGKPVNLHIFVVGGLIMLMGIFSFVSPQMTQIRDPQLKSMALLFNFLSWILVFPLMFVGANWNQNEPPP